MSEFTSPPASKAELDFPTSRIEEVVVCSSQGEVVYSWQCQDLEEKLKLLESLQSKAKQLTGTLHLGSPGRWELEGPEGRVITLLHPEWKLWIRVTRFDRARAA